MANAVLAQLIPLMHPALAWAAAATGLIPVVIHLINRRRFRRVPWAAMTFLLAANRRSAQRMRMEQLLLMAARIGIVVFAGLALARPYLAESGLPGLASAHVHRIVLLDNSISMQAKRPDSTTRFDAALAAANRLMASFPPDDGVSVVTMAAPAAKLIAQASYDRRVVRDRVAGVQGSQRECDAPGALECALEMIRESDAPAGNQVVYVLSDLTATTWESEGDNQPSQSARKVRELAEALGGTEPRLHFIRIDPGTSENVAITDIAAESSLIGLNVPARFNVRITNFGSTTARELSLSIRADGQTIRRQVLGNLAPAESTTASISTEFSTPGVKVIEARIIPSVSDSLALDDVRALSVEVRKAAPVLLVDGRPGLRPLDGQAGYLATALAPGSDGEARESTGRGGSRAASLVEPRIITEPELRGELLSTYDVVALCNVPQPSQDVWRNLESFVQRGGGLLICLGDLVTIDNYNRYGFADGQGVLPGRLDRPAEPTASIDRRLGFQLAERPHPMLEVFMGASSSGLFLARVDRYVPMRIDDKRGEVALRYTNGDPAMVVGRFGAGRVVVWTTSVNMEWNNLPSKGDFVALTMATVSAIAPPRGGHRNLLVGQTLREPLQAAESSLPLRFAARDTQTVEPSIVPVNDGLAAEFGPLEESEVLTLFVGSTARPFAVNADPKGFDLRPANQETLSKAIGKPIRWFGEAEEFDAVAGAQSTELSSELLFAVLALLLGETWLARRFGMEHSGRSPRARATPRAEAI